MSTVVPQATQSPVAPPQTLLDLLRQRAAAEPDAQACLYLGDGEVTRDELTFGQLDRRARALAARLQGLGTAGECVILLYPPGLEFLTALFGCVYAGVIAVPLPVPRPKASNEKFLGVVEDTGARVLLTTAPTLTRLGRLNSRRLDTLVALATEETPEELASAWRSVTPTPTDVAYLQYTSGSTASRKGVMIQHGNVTTHLRAIAERFGHHHASVSVNWLPHTHDLGLVSGMLQPLYHGHRNILMSPTAFVQQPIRWLEAITRYRGTYSNSPNFGYDLCIRRTTPEQRARLDLSSWEVALNGAEPVRGRTIDEFSTTFGPCGFRRESMYPAYGLAEATLVVSGGRRDTRPVTIRVRGSELERDRIVEADADTGARTLVGCGQAVQDTTIAIVDPVTHTTLPEGRTGEIWVRGPGVACGYWQRPEDTVQTFGATLAEGDGTPHLRTGDLGFMRDGHLFIAGRLKDLIIIRGSNHYPQDIEWTVEQSHAGFRPGCGAAFSVDADTGEQLVVAYEGERDALRGLDGAEMARCARAAVAEQHDLQVHALVLLKHGTVPRTTSGKIQRRQCRADYLAGELSVVWRDGTPDESPPAVPAGVPGVAAGATAASADDLCAWLRDYASDRLNSRLMDERRSITPPVILDFGNRGVLGLQVARDSGGAGFGHRQALRVVEQLGAIDQTLAMMTIVHNVLGIGPIVRHGDAALAEQWVPKLASGRELAAFAMTEPAAGSHPQGIESRARPDGPGAWQLTGQKLWSGTAGWAGVINVFAQTLDADDQPCGMSGFAVPRATRGLRMGPEALTLGMRGMVQNAVFLEGVRVTRAHCLGEPGGGLAVAQEAMMHGRLAIGAACVGGIKRCLQLLVRYAGQRTISTGRLLDNPVLLDRAGAWASALAGLEALVGVVADRLDRGEDVPGDAMVVCKIAGAEWFWRAADDLVQFLGGRGYVESNIAPQLLRDARVTRILEGPTEALGMYLGSRVMNDGRECHAFLCEALAAPAVSSRLHDAAAAILDRCLANRQFSPPDARRWACALIGQVATDAVLLAAMPATAGEPVLASARARFDASIAGALARAGEGGRFDAASVSALAAVCATSIGDVEQSLAGEEHALDALLRPRPIPAPVRPAHSSGLPAALSSVSRLDTKPGAAPDAELGAEPDADADDDLAPVLDPPPVMSEAAIEEAVQRWVARELKLPQQAVDARRSLFAYGLDSVTVVMLGAHLEDLLRVEVGPEAIYDTPVIQRLAARLARRQAGGGRI